MLRGVGYPKPDRSHFRSMAIWQTGSPDEPATTGWLGRWLDATGADPLLAVSLDALIPPMLAGAKIAGASLPVTGAEGAEDRTGPVAGACSGAGHRRRALAGARGEAIADLGARCRDARAGRATPARTPTTPTRRRRERRERPGRLGGRAERARPRSSTWSPLIELGVPTRVYSVSPGRLRHPLRRARHPAAAADRARHGLTSVPDSAGAATDRGRQVVTTVYSEFGRRVTANASDGTDHGTAGPVFVLGRGVAGGFYGARTQPDRPRRRRPQGRTGLPVVYASLLGSVLGAEPGGVLGGWEQRVDGLFA